MATYRLQCPQCGKALALDENLAADRLTVGCPSCRAAISIPQDVRDDAGARRAAALAKAQEQERRREAREAERTASQERKRGEAEERALEAEQRAREAEERTLEAEQGRREGEIEAALRVPPEAASPREAVAGKTLSGERVLGETHPAMFRNSPVQFILCVLLCFVGIGVVILLIWWLRCSGTKLTVTDSRVILRRGVLAKHTREVSLSDVRSVDVVQSLGQRIFGVGTLRIATAATAGIEIEAIGIPRPQEFAELVRLGRRPLR